MTESSYINGVGIAAQCANAIYNLQKDNDEIVAAEKSLSLFYRDEEIKGEAFDSLKQQISDYVMVLQAMRSANDSDIADFGTLCKAVGWFKVDGKENLEQQKVAKEAVEKNLEEYNYWREKANNASTFEVIFGMGWYWGSKANDYLEQADISKKIYNEYKAKEEKYDSIESTTSKLFTASTSTRYAVNKALEDMAKSFVDGKYVLDMAALWRTNIVNCYYDRVWKEKEDGSIELNMYEIKKILDKDAKDIMPQEYEVVTKAYLIAEDDEVAEIIKYMMGEPYRIEKTWKYHSDGCDVIDPAFAIWKLDKDKIQLVLQYAAELSEELLLLQQSERLKSNSDLLFELGRERESLLQKITLLKSVGEVGVYRGEYDAKYPPLDVKTKYNEHGAVECIKVSFLQTSKPDIHGFCYQRDSSIKIEGTDMSSDIMRETAKDIVYSFSQHLGYYSRVSDIAEFTAEKIEDKLVDKLAKEAGKVLGCKLVTCLPFVSDILELRVDIYNNEKDAEKEVGLIKDGLQKIDSAQAYAYFDCDANFVTYDTVESTDKILYPYVGELTDIRIAAFNSELGMEVSRERIFNDPNAVIKEIEELKRDPKKNKAVENILDYTKP